VPEAPPAGHLARSGTPDRIQRLGAVDWLRFIALIEIAGFHTALGRIPVLAGLGLPLLLVITNLFNCVLVDRRRGKQFLRDKLRRLLLPWVFWCAVFAAVTATVANLKGMPWSVNFSPRILLAGTYFHLWFVPFALFSAVAVVALHNATRSLPTAPVVVASFLAGVALNLLGSAVTSELKGIDMLARQWSFALPSILFGMALGRTLLEDDPAQQRRLLLLLALAGAAIWLVTEGLDVTDERKRYPASVFLCALALLMRFRQDRMVAFIAPLTLGIYLAHPLIIELMWARQVPWRSSIAWTACIIPATILLVWAMRRTFLRRFV